jgi:hypothetical protein
MHLRYGMIFVGLSVAYVGGSGVAVLVATGSMALCFAVISGLASILCGILCAVCFVVTFLDKKPEKADEAMEAK